MFGANSGTVGGKVRCLSLDETMLTRKLEAWGGNNLRQRWWWTDVVREPQHHLADEQTEQQSRPARRQIGRFVVGDERAAQCPVTISLQ
jgi:hypothetical protein